GGTPGPALAAAIRRALASLRLRRLRAIARATAAALARLAGARLESGLPVLPHASQLGADGELRPGAPPALSGFVRPMAALRPAAAAAAGSSGGGRPAWEGMTGRKAVSARA